MLSFLKLIVLCIMEADCPYNMVGLIQSAEGHMRKRLRSPEEGEILPPDCLHTCN